MILNQTSKVGTIKTETEYQCVEPSCRDWKCNFLCKGVMCQFDTVELVGIQNRNACQIANYHTN